MTALSYREFKQDVGRAEKLAGNGPVYINENNRTILVLLSFKDYHQLSSKGKNLAELLSMAADDDIEFDPPRL